jgi:hypothetical protein
METQSRPKWARKLTKKELAHLAENSGTGRPTLSSLKLNIAAQKENGSPCFECQLIASKLGLK